MSQTAQDMLRDPIWLGIAGVVIGLYLLFTAYTVLKAFRSESRVNRILRLALIAGLICSFVLLVIFVGKVGARVLVLAESFFAPREASIQTYSRAIGFDRSYAAAYFNRGFAYGHLEMHEQAIADYTEAIRLDPNYTMAYYNRGSAYYELTEYEKALADYIETIRLAPDFVWGHYSRGFAHLELTQNEEAIAAYTEAIRLDPMLADAYYNRGFAHYDLGQYEQAIPDFENYLRLAPPDDEPYITQAQQYIEEMQQRQ